MNKPVVILNLGILFSAEDQENKIEQDKSLSIEKEEPKEKHIPQKINLNKTITIIVFLIIIFIFYLFYTLLINQPNILNPKSQSDQIKIENPEILEGHAQKNQSQTQQNILNSTLNQAPIKLDSNIQKEDPEILEDHAQKNKTRLLKEKTYKYMLEKSRKNHRKIEDLNKARLLKENQENNSKNQTYVLRRLATVNTTNLVDIKKKITEQVNLQKEEKNAIKNPRSDRKLAIDLLEKYNTDCLFFFEQSFPGSSTNFIYILFQGKEEIDSLFCSDYKDVYEQTISNEKNQYGIAKVKKIKTDFDVKSIPDYTEFKSFEKHFKEKAITYEDMLVLCKKE